MNSEIIAVQNPSGERVRLRWYKVILIKGDDVKRQRIINEIQNLITDKKLLEHILFMYMYKVHTRNSSINSYVFLLIKSKTLYILPEEVKTHLIEMLDSKKYSSNIEFPKYLNFRWYDDLISFLEKEHKYLKNKPYIHNFRVPIPYKPVVPSNDPDPFNLSSETPITTVSSIPSETYDHLLYWLSSLGCGSWESFRSACNALKIPEPKRVLRRLKLLGHIETSTDGSRWSGTPITLVSVRASDPNQQEFILCGQRSLNLLSFLKLEQYAISCIVRVQGNAPRCIRVCLPHTEDISRLVNALVGHGFPIHNEGNASFEFAQALPSWQEWMQTLPRISAPILGYRYEYYNVQNSRFARCDFPNRTGMYQLTHERLQLPPRVCFFDQLKNLWLQGDWYGLRFLALQHDHQTLNAHYDRETASLYIPRSQRWSEIYERALVLASGCLPNVVETDFGRTLLHYQGIQAEVAELLTSKLNINLHQENQNA